MNEPLGTPERLGRYVIERELGRGMMGRVYRATDPELDRTVALKVVQVVESGQAAADFANYEQRFMAEARAAAALSHPGIVVVYDVGRDLDSGTLFIAFEYLKGRTLAELTATGTPIEWRTALRLVARTADALHHAHSHGIIHRDIKPANIMLLPSGEPKVMDFGIAKMRSSDLTAAGEFLGTPSYVSPEQASGEPVDGRSDLFSLGAVLYLLLTGRQPFEGKSVVATINRVVKVDPDPPSRFVAGLPRDADAVIARTLAKETEKRYRTGELLARELDRLLESKPPDLSQGPVSEPARRAEKPSEDSQATRALPSARLPQRRRVDLPARPAEPVETPDQGSGLARLGYLAVGAAVIAFVVGALTGEQPQPTSAPTPATTNSAGPPPPVVEPAQLSLALRHSLRQGGVKLWVGEELVLEEALSPSHGQTREVFDVRLTPGQFTLRVEVRSDQASWMDRREGSFASGARYEVEAILSGLPGERTSELSVFPVTTAPDP